MKKSVRYYKLNDKKQMLDLSSIPANQIILLLKNEEDMMFVEAIIDEDTKKYFWVTEKEVTFVEEKEEEWDENRSKEIYKILNQKWLEL
jgi:hypothetical protein